MISASQIPDYLPKYLTDHSYNELREAVKLFPAIAYDRFYSSYGIENDVIYQGDCLLGLPFLRSGKIIDNAKCFILSNTCDMEISENKRYFSSRIVFTPIIDANSYVESLKSRKEEKEIQDHFANICRQGASQIMYLPEHSAIPNGGLIFFDRLYHILSSDVDRGSLQSRRLFSLSKYGHYCMSIKLSHHFCRITAQTDKPATAPPEAPVTCTR